MINVLRVTVLLLLLPACSGRLYNHHKLVKNHNAVSKQTDKKYSKKRLPITIAGKICFSIIHPEKLTVNKMIFRQTVVELPQTKTKSFNNSPAIKRREAAVDRKQSNVSTKQTSKKVNVLGIIGFTFSMLSIVSLSLGFTVSEVFFISFLSLLLVAFILDLIAIRQMNKNYGKYNNKWMVTVSMAINMLLMSFLISFGLSALMFGFFFI